MSAPNHPYVRDRWARRGDRVAICHDPVSTPRRRRRWAAAAAIEVQRCADADRDLAHVYLAGFARSASAARREGFLNAMARALEAAARAAQLRMLAAGEL